MIVPTNTIERTGILPIVGTPYRGDTMSQSLDEKKSYTGSNSCFFKL
jgi:hypothetical protein